MTKTAKELLFDGYPEPLIKVVRAVPLFEKYNIPAWDRFGWLYNVQHNSKLTTIHNNHFREMDRPSSMALSTWVPVLTQPLAKLTLGMGRNELRFLMGRVLQSMVPQAKFSREICKKTSLNSFRQTYAEALT